VRRRYRGLIAAIARHRRKAGRLAEAFAHFRKVTRSYWPGLFRSYEVAGLPRTNNDLEQFFGSYRYHERRCSGRKVACPGTVVRGSVGVIQGDPARLQQVIWNLLSNAIKFTPKGARVQVTLRRTASSAEIVVSDTGVGIKPEFLPHVFDRFRQADNTITRQYRGLGLGLSIVKSLVELHGGTVEAASPGEGLGATFTVRLPLIAVQPRDETVSLMPPDTATGPGLAGLHVLVVDDELDAREMVACVLRERGATVTLAGSAAEGVRAFQESRPDVIVSDIGMPGQDGYDMIRQIRAISPGVTVPAAALTALARPEDRRRALLSGFQTHVAKPVDGLELVAVVAALAGRTGA
jgi:CheY-like chemotaxis protein